MCRWRANRRGFPWQLISFSLVPSALKNKRRSRRGVAWSGVACDTFCQVTEDKTGRCAAPRRAGCLAIAARKNTFLSQITERAIAPTKRSLRCASRKLRYELHGHEISQPSQLSCGHNINEIIPVWVVLSGLFLGDKVTIFEQPIKCQIKLKSTSNGLRSNGARLRGGTKGGTRGGTQGV